MSYGPAPPQQQRGSKFARRIIGVFILIGVMVVTAILILLGDFIDSAFFQSFDSLSMPNTSVTNIISNLQGYALGSWSIFGVIILFMAVIGTIAAILSMSGYGAGSDTEDY
jgi:hypothetical protein